MYSSTARKNLVKYREQEFYIINWLSSFYVQYQAKKLPNIYGQILDWFHAPVMNR